MLCLKQNSLTGRIFSTMVGACSVGMFLVDAVARVFEIEKAHCGFTAALWRFPSCDSQDGQLLPQPGWSVIGS